MECGLSAPASAGTVTFDVGGRPFKVLRQTIEAWPDTFLASLVDDIGTNTGEPIFVDANPERFGYILDWYRYNEMYVPEFVMGAVLRDAKFFLLPDVVRINGTSHVLGSSHWGTCDEVLMASKVEWPTCDQYVENTIRELRQQFETHFRDAQQNLSKNLSKISGNYCEEFFSNSLFPDKTIPVFDRDQQKFWLDNQNLNDFRRVWRLIAELTRRGFKCRLKLACRYESGHERYESMALRVGLGLTDFLSSGVQPSTSMPNHVKLVGVDAAHGRLMVQQQ